ncbi:MAG: glycosyltransferase [Geobacter sp.]|nr:MAG: glycosyltransferase [Geobacter sp.]
METPLVSIIITTHNRFELLCRAIDSVLSQTYKNTEIIVVDDYSSDGTEKKIIKYLGSVTFVRNSKNLGISASRNIGIRTASGGYISFLDDDDELLPFKIEKQIDFLNSNPGIDIVYCGSTKKFRSSRIQKLPKLKGNIFPEVLDSCPNAIHTILVNRKCFDRVGFFDEKVRYYEDFDFWIRLSRGCLFGFVPECLVIYNIHGCQMSTYYGEAISGIDYILDKHKEIFKVNKKYLYLHLRRQASKCAANDDYKLFYKYLFKSIQARPFYMSSYIHLLLSLVSRQLHKKLITAFGVKDIDGIVTF